MSWAASDSAMVVQARGRLQLGRVRHSRRPQRVSSPVLGGVPYPCVARYPGAPLGWDPYGLTNLARPGPQMEPGLGGGADVFSLAAAGATPGATHPSLPISTGHD